MAWSWAPIVVLIVGVALNMYRFFLSALPRPAEGGKLLTWDETQARYDANWLKGQLYLLIGPVIVIVTLAVNAFLPDVPDEMSQVGAQLVTVGVSLIFLVMGVQIAAAKRERDIGRRIPALADSITTSRVRFFLWLSLALPLTLLLAAISVRNLAAAFSLEGVAFALILARGRLFSKYLVKKRVQLPDGDALAARVREVFGSHDVKPSKFILTPSTVANAGVLPGGVVVMTTAARQLLTEDEIAAILVHELSHFRDKDLRKIRLTSIGSFLIAAIIVGGLGYLLVSDIHPTMLLPGFLGMLLTIRPLVMAVVGRISRRAEFKCDAAAYKAGLGPELASALDKVGRYMGHPKKWAPFHQLMLTHPSYADRFARLEGESSRRS